MRRILLLALLSLFFILPACGGGAMYKDASQASAYSQKYNKLVLFEGVIYKNGKEYGKYEVTNTDPTDKMITYKKMDNTVVATMELKGVSPEKAILNLSDGIATELKMREMEIEVTEEDGALYLIKEMILTGSEVKTENNTESNKEAVTELKADHKEATGNLNSNTAPASGATIKVSGQSEGNIDLRYGFKSGAKLHYKSIENVTINISMGGGMANMGMPAMNMGMNSKFMIETDFNLNIISVNADKSANFETVINSFKVYSMPDKKLMASDAGMKGLKVKGIITDKGKVTFLEDLYLVKTKNGETLLVSGKADNKNGKLNTSASAQAGGEKVDIQASFDPKTGKLTASTKITKVKKPAKKEIVIKKDDSKIEILPKKIMELFLLPENKISLGQKAEFSAPMMKVDFIAIQGGKPDCAKLESNFKTDKSNKMEGMDDEMLKMYPVIDAKINSKFNMKKGCLKAINGTITTTVNMQGMKMKVVSEIDMQKQDK